MKITVPEELFHAKSNGVLLPFLGAGVSASLGIPTWRSLLKKIAELLPSDEYRNKIEEIKDETSEIYTQMATEMMNEFGQDKFLEALKDALMIPREVTESGKLPERFHAMKQINVRGEIHGFVSTNIDMVMEKFCGFRRGDIIYRDSKNLTEKLKMDGFLFKIHGDIVHPETIIFTKEQYDTLISDLAYQNLLSKVFLKWTILFIGYSINDRYIWDLLEKLHELHRGELEIFILLPDPSFEQEVNLNRIGVRAIPYMVTDKDHTAVDAFLSLLDSNDFVPSPEFGFRGRKREINQIKEFLQKGITIIELLGNAGVGKTQTARATVQQIRLENNPELQFGTSVFVDLVNRTGAEVFVYGLRDALGLSPNITNEREIFGAAVAKHALIIADNAESPLSGPETDLKEFLGALNRLCKILKGKGAIIITSRSGLPDLKEEEQHLDTGQMKLGPLDSEASRELLVLESGSANISPAADTLLSRLANNPGSIRVLGRRVRAKKDEEREEIYKTLLQDPEKASETILRTTLELIPQDARTAFLQALSFPVGLSQSVAEYLMGEKYIELLSPAIKHGLLHRNAGRYKAAEYIRDILLSNTIKTEILQKSFPFYTDKYQEYESALNDSGSKYSKGEFLRMEFPNIQASIGIVRDDNIVGFRKILGNICRFFIDFGFLIDPQKDIEFALQGIEEKGSLDPQLLERYALSLSLYGGNERRVLATKILQDSLQYQKNVDITSSPIDSNEAARRIARIKLSLGYVLITIGGFSNNISGENMYREALEEYKSIYGNTGDVEDLSKIVQSKERLALSLEAQGKTGGINVIFLDKAEKLFREAIIDAKKVAEIKKEQKVHSLEVNLASLLKFRGGNERYEESERIFRAVLQYQREKAEISGLKSHNALTAFNANNLAGLLSNMGGTKHIEEAEALYKESMSIYKKISESSGSPGDKTFYAMILQNIAVLLAKHALDTRFNEGFSYFKESLNLFHENAENSGTPLDIVNYANAGRNVIDSVLKLDDKSPWLKEAAVINRKVFDVWTSSEEAVISLMGNVKFSQLAERLIPLLIESDDNEILEEAEMILRHTIFLRRVHEVRSKDIIEDESMKPFIQGAIEQQQQQLNKDKIDLAEILEKLGGADRLNEADIILTNAFNNQYSMISGNKQATIPMLKIWFSLTLRLAKLRTKIGDIEKIKESENAMYNALIIYRKIAQENQTLLPGAADFITEFGKLCNKWSEKLPEKAENAIKMFDLATFLYKNCGMTDAATATEQLARDLKNKK